MTEKNATTWTPAANGTENVLVDLDRKWTEVTAIAMVATLNFPGAGPTEPMVAYMLNGKVFAAPVSFFKQIKTKANTAPKVCECGCGGSTKGGRFIPGHDAKLHGKEATRTEVRAHRYGEVGEAIVKRLFAVCGEGGPATSGAALLVYLHNLDHAYKTVMDCFDKKSVLKKTSTHLLKTWKTRYFQTVTEVETWLTQVEAGEAIRGTHAFYAANPEALVEDTAKETPAEEPKVEEIAAEPKTDPEIGQIVAELIKESTKATDANVTKAAKKAAAKAAAKNTK